MEIRDVKIFYEVYKLGSTLKAAESLGYVQSNVSKRILKLEEEIEKKLFLRNNRGMSLTKDGEKFLNYAEKILDITVEMEKEFLEKEEKIYLGATGTISKIYLKKYYLEKNIEIFTRDANELIRLLKEKKLDFIIINKELKDNNLEQVFSFTENMYWIVANENKAEFDNNIIIVSRDINCPYKIETDRYIEEEKLERMRVVEVDTIDVLLDMIEKNSAVAILPEKILDSNQNLKKIEEKKLKEGKIYLYKLKDNKKKIENFFCNN